MNILTYRGNTARTMTAMSHEIRLGTALLNNGLNLVDMDRLDVKKYGSRKGLSMILVNYMIHVRGNIKKALELCAECTRSSDYMDWWWKLRLGKCYYKFGMTL